MYQNNNLTIKDSFFFFGMSPYEPYLIRLTRFVVVFQKELKSKAFTEKLAMPSEK